MTEKLGGIVYDKQAALYPGAEYPKTENLETEILVMDGDLDGYQENDAVEEENSTGNTDKDTGKGIVSEREGTGGKNDRNAYPGTSAVAESYG